MPAVPIDKPEWSSGIQYLSIRYTERLAEVDAVASVGSKGDSYDNALAESVNGLFKAELINRRGPWRTLDQLDLATAEWVHFWNEARLHEAAATCRRVSSRRPTMRVRSTPTRRRPESNQPSLHETQGGSA